MREKPNTLGYLDAPRRSSLPPNLLLDHPLLTRLSLKTYLSQSSVKTTTKQPRPQSLPAPRPHHFPSNPNPEYPHLKRRRRNGRSERAQARNGREKDYEYKVRWVDTWLPRSELGNAQQLLRLSQAQRRARRSRWGTLGKRT